MSKVYEGLIEEHQKQERSEVSYWLSQWRQAWRESAHEIDELNRKQKELLKRIEELEAYAYRNGDG